MVGCEVGCGVGMGVHPYSATRQRVEQKPSLSMHACFDPRQSLAQQLHHSADPLKPKPSRHGTHSGRTVGCGVGLDVGCEVGCEVGRGVGLDVGCGVGMGVGSSHPSQLYGEPGLQQFSSRHSEHMDRAPQAALVTQRPE